MVDSPVAEAPRSARAGGDSAAGRPHRRSAAPDGPPAAPGRVRGDAGGAGGVRRAPVRRGGGGAGPPRAACRTWTRTSCGATTRTWGPTMDNPGVLERALDLPDDQHAGARSKRRWRCSGTTSSPPAGPRASTPRRWSSQIDMFRRERPGQLPHPAARALARPGHDLLAGQQREPQAGSINENYGRELLELFSMGIGNYTETTSRTCARAFTGWTFEQPIPLYPYGHYDSRFVYRADDHDDGEKTFLGQHGRLQRRGRRRDHRPAGGDGPLHRPPPVQLLRRRRAAGAGLERHRPGDPEAIETLVRAYQRLGRRHPRA